MHILFLTQVLPYPLDAGPKVRAYYLLRYLAQYHKITLVSFVRSTDTQEAVRHLGQYCANVFTCPMPRSKLLDGAHLLRSLATNQPFLIARDEVTGMYSLLEAVIAECGPFDAVHADQLWMAPYALHIKQSFTQDRAPAAILDQHNAVYLIPQRMAADTRNPIKRDLLQLESQKLAHFEVETCRHFDHVLWVTEDDYRAVASQASRGSAPLPNSGVIPICVDVEAESYIQSRPGVRRVTFLGGLHYPPNAEGVCWFAQKVFPQVIASIPDAILTIIGKQPPNLNGFGIPQANLDITGYVADPTPYLEETAVFIVPLHAGGGMRVKILDAWRWGLPIVSTTVGAEGLRLHPGETILIADSPAEFAQATLQLLTNPAQGDALAQTGRAWVKEHYSWRRTYQMLDKIYPPSGGKLSGGILSDGDIAQPHFSGLTDPLPI